VCPFACLSLVYLWCFLCATTEELQFRSFAKNGRSQNVTMGSLVLFCAQNANPGARVSVKLVSRPGWASLRAARE